VGPEVNSVPQPDRVSCRPFALSCSPVRLGLHNSRSQLRSGENCSTQSSGRRHILPWPDSDECGRAFPQTVAVSNVEIVIVLLPEVLLPTQAKSGLSGPPVNVYAQLKMLA